MSTTTLPAEDTTEQLLDQHLKLMQMHGVDGSETVKFREQHQSHSDERELLQASREIFIKSSQSVQSARMQRYLIGALWLGVACLGLWAFSLVLVNATNAKPEIAQGPSPTVVVMKDELERHYKGVLTARQDEFDKTTTTLQMKIIDLESKLNASEVKVSALQKLYDSNLRQKDEQIAQLRKQTDSLSQSLQQCSIKIREFDPKYQVKWKHDGDGLLLDPSKLKGGKQDKQ
jgi:hypothetical protein